MASCGCYFIIPNPDAPWAPSRKQLPLVSLKSHTTVVSLTSRTTLTQTFVNPQQDKPIAELRYAFPLYDGVSVVAFVCTINNDRVIRGRVKEKDAARRAYKDAVDRGETAGLLEQQPDAADVFTTTIGNVPAAAEIRVDVTYLGELKHDAEADGMRFTIPTTIAPRYGSTSHADQLLPLPAGVSRAGGIDITIDVELPAVGGNHIKTIKSPSHPISVEMKAAGATGMSAATAELSISSLELEKDVVVIVVPAKPDAPVAVLEQHPTIARQRALMATFVPRFNLPQTRPEIVFVCDRSGSMGSGKRIPNLKAALHVFLRSLPVGTKFNIVSFGSSHSFLFDRSRSYDQSSLDEASRHVDTFDSDYGGTEMHNPIDDVFKRRYTDMNLEVFVLTDGEVWNQNSLFDMVNSNMAKSQGAARLFTLGIGNDVSTALVEGLARAGRGFAQIVGDDEKLNSKVVRMLKASLSPHVNDYTLEIQYGAEVSKTATQAEPKEDFEMLEAADSDSETVVVEKVLDALTLSLPDEADKEKAGETQSSDKKPISLFDSAVDPDAEQVPQGDAAATAGEPKYAHVPAVPIPKFLQAPFEIPPMYNFSRTSIYVLLGPSSNQRTPKALVLRGTAASHGPVELSIPVQALAQPGETVHQLAAKKAVQDLEEGRGWLVQARDAADGKLLKEKHEGRFGDMVEREAVRLGVEFQVGGKWCSFVAIDDKTDKIQATAPAPAPAAEPEIAEIQAMMAPPVGGAVRYRMAAPQSPAPAPARASRSLFGAFSRSASKKAAAPSATSLVNSMMFQSSAAQPVLRSSAPPAASPKGMARGGGGGGVGSLMSVSAESAQEEEDDEEESDAEQGFGLFDSGPTACAAACPPPPPPPGAPTGAFSMPGGVFQSGGGEDVSSEPLPTIVKQQDFEGSWSWSPSLRTAMGLTEEAVAEKLPAAVASSKVGATVCVVVFLRKKLADSADEWEMLVEKAVAWLEDQGVAVSTLLADAEALF